MEQSYAQAKIAKAHIEGQQRQSKGRQASLKGHIKGLQGESRLVWLELRQKRREIVEENRGQEESSPNQITKGNNLDALPPYKRNLLSSSLVGLTDGSQGSGGDPISLPRAFQRRVDRESMEKSKEIIRQVAIEVGGLVDEDKVEGDEYIRDEEDLPGFELSFQ